jgi:SAM-dependent methyltransferase
MRPEHVEVLACVSCRGPLTLLDQEMAPDGHAIRGTLQCERCGARYPLTGGVPRLMTGAQPATVDDTVSAFGYQWEQATRVLADTRFSHPDVFLDFIKPVEADSFKGKAVLDGGCGSGRFTILSAGFGARLVVGVDLSTAVDIAFERTRHLPGVVIVQGDMLRLPVRRIFDYAFSVGVLHHTSDPRGSFHEMASKIVAGGAASAWVYGRENNEWIVRYLNPLRRLTSRLPRPLLLVGAHVAAVPLTLILKLVYGPLARSGHWPGIRRRLFYFDYMAFLAQFGYRDHAYIVFDHAVPAIADYIRRDDFAEWFASAGLEQVTITSRASNSWRGYGLVPGR